MSKTNKDWREQFELLIADGAVEVRMILKGILDNCTGHEDSTEEKYSEVVKTIEEFDTLLEDDSISRITSLKIISKAELIRRKL